MLKANVASAELWAKEIHREVSKENIGIEHKDWCCLEGKFGIKD